MFKHPLAREIAVVLVIKLLLVTLIGLHFFGPETKVTPDAQGVAESLLGISTSAATQPPQ
jgi:hypothetical protein